MVRELTGKMSKSCDDLDFGQAMPLYHTVFEFHDTASICSGVIMLTDRQTHTQNTQRQRDLHKYSVLVIMNHRKYQ